MKKIRDYKSNNDTPIYLRDASCVLQGTAYVWLNIRTNSKRTFPRFRASPCES